MSVCAYGCGCVSVCVCTCVSVCVHMWACKRKERKKSGHLCPKHLMLIVLFFGSREERKKRRRKWTIQLSFQVLILIATDSEAWYRSIILFLFLQHKGMAPASLNRRCGFISRQDFSSVSLRCILKLVPRRGWGAAQLIFLKEMSCCEPQGEHSCNGWGQVAMKGPSFFLSPKVSPKRWWVVLRRILMLSIFEFWISWYTEWQECLSSNVKYSSPLKTSLTLHHLGSFTAKLISFQLWSTFCRSQMAESPEARGSIFEMPTSTIHFFGR